MFFVYERVFRQHLSPSPSIRLCSGQINQEWFGAALNRMELAKCGFKCCNMQKCTFVYLISRRCDAKPSHRGPSEMAIPFVGHSLQLTACGHRFYDQRYSHTNAKGRRGRRTLSSSTSGLFILCALSRTWSCRAGFAHCIILDTPTAGPTERPSDLPVRCRVAMG